MEAQVLVCGSGECEQLGLPECVMARRPRALSLPQSLSMIACGAMHTLALTPSGVVFSWGCNDDGALGRYGAENEPISVNNLQPIAKISAGDSHSAAYASQARVLYCWGKYRNREGNMTKGSREPREIGKIALKRHGPVTELLSGANHTLVLVDGKVYAWGDCADGQIARIPRSRRSVEHSLEIESTGLRNIVKIFTGKYHSFAMNKDGVFLGWGLNNYGQLGDGSEESTHIPHKLPSLSGLGITQIVGGENHSIALTVHGTLYAWGRNDDYQLGLNCTEHQYTPQLIRSLWNVQSVACGSHFSFAMANNLVYSWGYGDCYVLLNGREGSVSMPTLASWSVGKGIAQLHAGSQHVILFRSPVALLLESTQSLKRKATSPDKPRKKVRRVA